MLFLHLKGMNRVMNKRVENIVYPLVIIRTFSLFFCENSSAILFFFFILFTGSQETWQSQAELLSVSALGIGLDIDLETSCLILFLCQNQNRIHGLQGQKTFQNISEHNHLTPGRNSEATVPQ